MSLDTIPASAFPLMPDRRIHPRRRLHQLAYIGFGPDSGGVLLDISEGGLNCQIVGPVITGGTCRLKFTLPGMASAIETDAQVVWSNSSRQGGGIRLLALAEDHRRELRDWLYNGADSYSRVQRPSAPVRVQTHSAVAAFAVPSEPPPAVVENVPRELAPEFAELDADVQSAALVESAPRQIEAETLAAVAELILAIELPASPALAKRESLETALEAVSFDANDLAAGQATDQAAVAPYESAPTATAIEIQSLETEMVQEEGVEPHPVSAEQALVTPSEPDVLVSAPLPVEPRSVAAELVPEVVCETPPAEAAVDGVLATPSETEVAETAALPVEAPCAEVKPIPEPAGELMPAPATEVPAAPPTPANAEILSVPFTDIAWHDLRPVATRPLVPRKLIPDAARPVRPVPPPRRRNTRVVGLAAAAGCFSLLAASVILLDTDFPRAASLERNARTPASVARPTPALALPSPVVTPVLPQPRAANQSPASSTPAAPAAAGVVPPVLVRPQLARPPVPAPVRPVETPRPPAAARPAEAPARIAPPAATRPAIPARPVRPAGNRENLNMAAPRPPVDSSRPPADASAAPISRSIAPPPISEPPRTVPDDVSSAGQTLRPLASSYEPPELTMRVEPVYSRMARETRLQGTVQVSAIIGRDGIPHSLVRLSGNALLGEMAFTAVRQWLYRPALLNGHPTEARTIVTITFQLH